MRSLRELLPRSHEEPGEKKNTHPTIHPDEKTVFFLLNRLIEEQYGTRGRTALFPSRYADGVVWVRVTSPLWANELSIQKEIFCQCLNSTLGGEVVLDMKIWHGALPKT